MPGKVGRGGTSLMKGRERKVLTPSRGSKGDLPSRLHDQGQLVGISDVRRLGGRGKRAYRQTDGSKVR